MTISPRIFVNKLINFSLSFRPVFLRGLDCRKFRLEAVRAGRALGGRLASALRRMHDALEPTAWLCVQ